MTRRPPLVSAEYPSLSLKFITLSFMASIPSITGRKSNLKSTAEVCTSTRFLACPLIPKPVMSVAPWH